MIPNNLLAYYVVAAVAIVGNTVCTLDIWIVGCKSVTSTLALYLHVTQLVDCVASLPFVYSQNSSLCAMMGFLRNYSCVANVLVNVFAVLSANDLLFHSDPERYKLASWKSFTIFGFPLMTLLAFSTGSYGRVGDDGWCSFPRNALGNIWSYVLVYSWVWLLLLFITVKLIRILWLVRLSPDMALKVVRSLGIYAVVNLLCWVPRSMARIGLSETNLDLSYLLVFVTGILYSCVHAVDRPGLARFEEYVRDSFDTSLLITAVGFDDSVHSELSYELRVGPD